jgi:hypothetical protein
MSVRGKTITFTNPHVDITNLTIKDLPVECSDEFVAGHLLKIGRIVNDSVVHGIKTGTDQILSTDKGETNDTSERQVWQT